MKSFLLLLLLIPMAAVPALAQPRLIDIDGAAVLVNTIGTDSREAGQPLIILESGHGTPMGHWDRILAGLAELGPVLAYDRPGIGGSEPDAEMPTARHVADKLLRILDELELGPPYLLVGHSLGGAYVRGFAGFYPEWVAGLVIIDPADFTETQENKRLYYDVLGWDEARIDEQIAADLRVRTERAVEAPASIREESEVLEAMRDDDFREILDYPLPNVPVHILAGGRFDLPERFRSPEYDQEALFRSKLRHRLGRWLEVVQSV
ncbi:MAG: alpha/beta fold hydrolase, partial [Lewinella sp.]|nr:alpha/beta fold hydrolase [Lewinella sp.]